MPTDQSHDDLFHITFRRPEVVREHFRKSIPPAVDAAADWESLEFRPESFLDEDTKEFQSDILYRVRLTGEDEVYLYLYLLLDYRERPDPLMPFRILQRMVRIWESWLEEHPGRLPLPFIWPSVIRTGTQPWTTSTQPQDTFLA